MTPKIIQIMPAPAGSYITTVHLSAEDSSVDIYPASCIALLEVETNGETLRYIYPVGFGDSMSIAPSGLDDSTLHPSEAAAKLYLAERARSVRLTELVSEYEAESEASFAVFDEWSAGTPSPQSASTPTSKQGEPHPPHCPESRS